MRRLLIVGTLLLVPTFANAQLPSCETVRSMAHTLSRDKINELMAQATPEQIAYGKKCLAATAPGASSKSARQGWGHTGNTLKKKVKIKGAPAHKLPVVAPLPRPKPVEATTSTHDGLTGEEGCLINRNCETTTVIASLPTETRRSPVSEYVFWALVVYGLIALTYHVGKYGVLPTYNAIKSFATRGRAEVAALNQEIQTLKAQVALQGALQGNTLRAVAGPAPVTPSPSAPPTTT